MKIRKLGVIHVERRSHVSEKIFLFFSGHQRKIPAQLSDRERALHLLLGPVCLVEQRLRVSAAMKCGADQDGHLLAALNRHPSSDTLTRPA